MKKLFLLLLCSTAVFAQDKIYNVQQYCVDNQPFTAKGCDLSGNEYSFVFVDSAKKQVVFFLSDTKLKYEIVSSTDAKSGKSYKLKNEQGIVDMTINAANNRIEFLEPTRKISLKVGKSTKLQ